MSVVDIVHNTTGLTLGGGALARQQYDAAPGGTGGGHGHSHGGDHGHSHGGDHGHSHEGGKCGGQHVSRPRNVFEACNANILPYLIETFAAGVEIADLKDDNAATLMHYSALGNGVSCIRFLLDQGADINKVDSHGQAPLHWATAKGNLHAVDELLRCGADWTIRDKVGYTPFIVASQFGFPLCMHQFLAQGKVVQGDADNEGHNALHWGAYNGHFNVVRYAVESMKLDVDQLDVVNRSAMHWAAREGRVQICRYLAKKGAKLNEKDKDGETPLTYARRRFHKETENFIRGAMRGAVEVPSESGTLTFLTSSREVLLRCLLAIAYFIISYMFIMPLLPGLVAYFVIFGFFAKTVVDSFFETKGVRGGRKETEMLDMGPDLILNGPDHLRKRETANFFGFLAFFGIQLAALSRFEVAPVVPPLAILVGITIFMTKVRASKNYVQPLSNIADSEAFAFVERREFDCIHDAAICKFTLQQRPLRSHYEYRVDRLVRKLDHFSQLLDCPIGKYNIPWDIAFCLALCALECVMAYTTYNYVLYTAPAETILGKCEPTDCTMSWIWAMMSSGMPCSNSRPRSKEWYNFFMPTSVEINALFCTLYAFYVAVLTFAMAAHRLNNARTGRTELEQRPDVMVPGSDGLPVSILRPGNRGQTVYSEATGFANIVSTMCCMDRNNWEAQYRLPKASTSIA